MFVIKRISLILLVIFVSCDCDDNTVVMEEEPTLVRSILEIDDEGAVYEYNFTYNGNKLNSQFYEEFEFISVYTYSYDEEDQLSTVEVLHSYIDGWDSAATVRFEYSTDNEVLMFVEEKSEEGLILQTKSQTISYLEGGNVLSQGNVYGDYTYVLDENTNIANRINNTTSSDYDVPQTFYSGYSPFKEVHQLELLQFIAPNHGGLGAHGTYNAIASRRIPYVNQGYAETFNYDTSFDDANFPVLSYITITQSYSDTTIPPYEYSYGRLIYSYE